MAKFLVVVSILMLFVFSWMNYNIDDIQKALTFGLSGLAIIAFSFIYGRYLKPAHDKASRDKLLDWVLENTNSIKNGRAQYKQIDINLETILTRYCVVYSFVFFTRKTYTNYVIKDTGRSVFVGILTTLSNLIVGWWGLPWGPIYTLQSLYINVASKDFVTVKDIIGSGLPTDADI